MKKLILKTQTAGDLAIGSLVNGEVDRMVITSPGECDIFDIKFESRNVISLSEKYAVLVFEQSVNLARTPSHLKVGDNIVIYEDGRDKVKEITVRRGQEILIPKSISILNGVYALRIDMMLNKQKFDNTEDKNKRDTCKFRSESQVTKQVKTSCCGSPQNVTAYECLLMKVLLIQPKCHNCEFYKNKE